MSAANSTLPKRPYLFEVDLLRAITTFTVVAIHSLSSVSYLATTSLAVTITSVVIHSLHYNRETFMFITGLILTYVYYYRPGFSATDFWRRRLSLVFVPYVVWTCIYTLADSYSSNPMVDIGRSLKNVVTGNGSSQLYYIILALQFYALFPVFLWCLRKVARRPWLTLSISLGIQLVAISLDYFLIQTGRFSNRSYTNFVVTYQDRVFPSYQFFFILGGFAGIYMEAIKIKLQTWGRYMPLLAGTGLLILIGSYFIQVNLLHMSSSQATDVLQPSVVLYSISMIILSGWMAIRWAQHRAWQRAVTLIAESSFGIYFVHVLFLTFIDRYLFTILPDGTPIAVTDLFVVLTTFGLSLGFCVLLLQVPSLGWSIGKPSKSKPVKTMASA
jgi:peptidoglycan/LPS O-acetylase OafA/YrhL